MNYLTANSSNLWLIGLLCGWILTTSGLRKLQVVILHHCAHINFSGHKKFDRYLGRLISILLIVRSFDSYKTDHIKHHQAKKLLTLEDETVRFLFLWLGLRPGMPKKQIWQKFYSRLVSIQFHLRFFFARVAACFLSDSPSHNAFSIGFWGLVLTFITFTHTWMVFLLVWIVPLTVFYQISVCFRLAAEHEWPLSEEVNQQRDKRFVCQSTKAIFLGEATPSSELPFLMKVLSWGQWWLRLIFIHLLSRLFVLQGDTPVHDVHHRHPGTDDWANALFVRQQELEAGCPRFPQSYQAHWGLLAAIDAVFYSLSLQAPMSELNDRHHRVSVY